MIPIKSRLTSIFTSAISTAFPVKDVAQIEYSKHSDLVCKSPSQIYNKYRKEQVCFGLFNSREIADCIFVNVERDYLIKRVEVSGMGDLKIFLNDEFLYNAVGDIYENQRIYAKEIQGHSRVIMMEWCRDLNIEGSVMKDRYYAETYQRIYEAMGGRCEIDLCLNANNQIDIGKIDNKNTDLKIIVPLYSDKHKSYISDLSKIIHSGDLLFNLPHSTNVSYDKIKKYLYKSLPDTDPNTLNQLLNNSILYEVLIHDLSNTFYISSSSLLKVSKDSYLGMLKILSYLHSKSHISTPPISSSILESDHYRHLILHILKYKDTLHDSLSSFSSKLLIEWLNKLIEYLVVLEDDSEVYTQLLKCSFVVIRDCLRVLGITHSF
jgi:hypothetical protein